MSALRVDGGAAPEGVLRERLARGELSVEEHENTLEVFVRTRLGGEELPQRS